MTDKIIRLREMFALHGIDAYLQPVHDEWMSEYPPACNRRVEWLTGFSGSAGMVVVTTDKAAIFVDGRYTLQARGQAGAEYMVFNSADITPQEWLCKQLQSGAKIGYDPKLYTKVMLDKFICQPALVAGSGTANEVNDFIPVANLIDMLWQNRPPAPATALFIHDIAYSGETSSSKRTRVAEAIKKSGADAAFSSSPECVNWLLNIRARDVENTPLCLAYAIIDTQGDVRLFIDPERCNAALREHLGSGVKICSPDALEPELHAFSQKTILFDSQTMSVWAMDLFHKAGAVLLAGQDPCLLLKAIKNPVELAGIRNSHIRDGVAVTKLLFWLEEQENITELEVVDKLLLLRMQNDLFLEPSFDTIAGSGAHGAIVHYRSTQESNRALRKGELFLLDSGGQYFDGTTDITRTVAIGAPDAEHKDRFTRVLKGHIALAVARFPEGTSGSQLDILARQYLWQDGIDYDHGTGHGVGCFLSVHEGPQRISKRAGDPPLVTGMVLSNEPGYYKTGEYGIRIENLVEVVEKSFAENRKELGWKELGGKKFLGFNTLTCVPIDRKLIDITLLSNAEKEWLNNYHNWVKTELHPHLDEHGQQWLAQQCASI